MDGTLSPDKNYVWHDGQWIPAQLSPDAVYYAYQGQWHNIQNQPIQEPLGDNQSSPTNNRVKKYLAIFLSLSILSAGLFFGLNEVIYEVIENVGEDGCTEGDSRDLSFMDLSNDNMRGANLSYADFTSADLTGADLTGADLCGAQLTGAILTGAKVSGADLT